MDQDRYWYRHYAWYHWWPTTWQGRLATVLSVTPLIGGFVYALRVHPGPFWVFSWISISLICIALPLVFFSDRFEMLSLQSGCEEEDVRPKASLDRAIIDTIEGPAISEDVKAKVLQNMTHSADDDLKDVY